MNTATIKNVPFVKPTVQVTPVPAKLPQLRRELHWRYGHKVWMYTVAGDTVTLHGASAAVLADVVRLLAKDGLVA